MKNLKFLLCTALIGLSGAASASTLYHPYTYTENGVQKVGCGASRWYMPYSDYYDNDVIYDNQTYYSWDGYGIKSLYCSNGTITYYSDYYLGAL
ncbi:MAG: hypothetical protein ABIT83_08900 [Massilia sp.]